MLLELLLPLEPVEDELDPDEDEPEPVPPVPLPVEDVVSSTGADAQNPSTGLHISPSQQLSSSMHALARSPASTQDATQTGAPITPSPAS